MKQSKKLRSFLSLFLSASLVLSLTAPSAMAYESDASLNEDDSTQDFVPFETEEVLTAVDSLEEAEAVADYYGITLLSYSDGIAVYSAPTEAPEESISLFGVVDMPELYANVTYELFETGIEEIYSYEEIYTYEENSILATTTINVNQYHLDEIDAPEAWETSTGETSFGDKIVVAIIDTGVDTDHPNLVANLSEKSYNSYTMQGGLTYVEDDHGHGTHVAGIIGATVSSAYNVYGVSPDVELLIIKANTSNKSTFSDSSLTRAINYAVNNDADVINMSLGSHYDTPSSAIAESVIDAAVAAGVTVVCAAGNASDDHAAYPAAYASTIAVSGLAEGYVFDDSYSNYGPEIDIAAMGTSILSTYTDARYAYSTGTSMACPVVAGVAALILAENPTFTPAQVKDRLTSTAREAGDLGWDEYYGYGVVNAYSAVLGEGALNTVTYNYNDGTGTTVSTDIYTGGTLLEPNNPVGSYAFLYWTTDAAGLEKFDFSSPITENTTLYAQWDTDETVPAIGTATFSDATYGDSYSVTLSETADASSVSWAVSSGALPAGLTLNTSTGAISGTIAEVGNFAFTITVSNSHGSDSKEFNLTVSPLTLALSWDSTQSFTYDGTAKIPTASITNKLTGDDVSLVVTGAQTEVSANYTATVTGLTGADAGNYSLPTSNTTCSFTISAKNVAETQISTTTNIVVGLGTFTAPSFAYTGTLTYTIGETVYESYDAAVDYLKSLSKDTTGTISYSFTASGNYSGIITGSIDYTIVDIAFTGAISIATSPTYGNTWGEIITGHSYTASLGGNTVDGTFTLLIDGESYETSATPKAGNYGYSLTFTGSTGSITYTDVSVASGTITVSPRTAVIAWDSTIAFKADGTEKLPTATITNALDGDEVSLVVDGAQTEASNTAYTATVTGFSGADAGNYSLPETNVTCSFTITEKTIPTITLEAITKDYDGTAITVDDIVATVTETDTETDTETEEVTTISGAWSFDDSEASIKNVSDTGVYPITFTPSDTENYATVNTELSVEIQQATIVITADNKTVTNGSSAPTFSYTTTGLVTGETLLEAPSTVTAPDANYSTDGTYTIVVSTDASASSNYKIVYVDGTLTVYTATVSGGGISSGGGGGVVVSTEVEEETSSTVETSTNDDGDTTSTITPETTTEDDTSSATLTEEDITAGLEALSEETGDGSGTVAISVDSDENVLAINVTLPTASLEDITSSEVSNLVISTLMGDVDIPVDALENISSQADEDSLVISIAQVSLDDMDVSTDSAVNEDTLIVSLNIYSGDTKISNFQSTLTITLPYTLKDGESAEKIAVWHIGDAGTITAMPTSYDAENETVSFTTNHFSYFAVVHVDMPFTDVLAGDWFYSTVKNCYELGLMNGTSDTTFEPYSSTSRAMVVTMLHRLAGEPDWDICYPFADVDTDMWYTDAVYWAYTNGIVNGVGDELFAPDQTVTREELATMLYRYAQSLGLGFEGTWMFQLDYEDTDLISSWASEAIHWMSMNSILEGSEGYLNPQNSATRAEVATIFSRFVALLALEDA